MKTSAHTTWIIAGLGAAVVIAAGGFAISQLPPPDSSARAGSSAVSPSHGGANGSGGSSSGAGESGGSAGSGSNSGGGGGSPVHMPPTAGKRYTTEVIPPKPTSAPALPPSTGLPRPVAAPLPATASATGKLVAGFPAAALPAAPGSTISSSSVASQGEHLQVSLVAKSSRAAIDIVAFYRAALAAYGMYDMPAPAVAGSTAVAFSRGGDSVTVTATPGTGGTSYVVYGTFTVAS